MEGSTLGPYRIEAELGSGGMGDVYRAEALRGLPELEPGASVALKVIHPHLLESEGFFKRFLREADIGQSIDHPNVVRTFDCDQIVVAGIPHCFLVMEYVDGQTLRALVRELGQVPEELCRHVGREIAKGLRAIHEAGVVHRDLKPENVLITDDHVVKVMDLGVARLKDEAMRLSETGVFVGSLQYAAPEQFEVGAEEVDGRADLHALGTILFELATGAHPFQDDDPRVVLRKILEERPRRCAELNPQLSPFLEEVVHSLLAKRRDERFTSAAALLTVLEEGEGSAWWTEREKALRRTTRRPLRRMRIPRETALYGRDAELETLRSCFDAVKAGEGRVLLLEGEAGIGKTRLVDEFVGLLQQEGEDLSFLFGSFPPGGAATAAGAFTTAYREQFGPDGSRPYLKETSVLAPAFDALLRGEPPPRGEEPLTRDSLQTVFVHTTRALAAERPTIVLVDDLHFAPEEGRAIFASLALAVPEHRVLLVGTMRPGLPRDWIANFERYEHAQRLVVPRLGPKDLVRLLEDAFHSERLARQLAARIAVKSDGNPFFAFEIIRGLREGHFISRQTDGTWASTKAIEDIHVPSSVQDLVTARVADLTEEERDLLEVASCCGFDFDPLLVAAVAGADEIAALKRLGQIEKKHQLVRSSGRRFLFDHNQIQEVLYEGLSLPLRERYHSGIARALEATLARDATEPADLEGPLPVSLCTHHLQGVSPASALGYLDAALTHLGRSYANDTAISLARRALAIPELLGGRPRLDVLLAANERLHLLGRSDDQQAVLEEAHRLAEAHAADLLPEVERALGNLRWRTGRYEEARAHHERCVSLAREAGDLRTEGLGTGSLGLVCLDEGRYDEAKVFFETSLSLSRGIGDRTGEARATGNLASVYLAQGRYADARENLEHCLRITRETGDRRAEAAATGNLGLVYYSQALYAAAETHLERQLHVAREIGDREGEERALGSLGNVSLARGHHESARARFEQSLALAREIGDLRGEAAVTGNLGGVAHAEGRYADALEAAEQALTLVREIGDREGEASALGGLGVLLCSLGSYEEAMPHLQAQLALAQRIGDREGEGWALGDLANAQLDQGRHADASAGYAGYLEIAREIGDRQGEAHALLGLARARLASDAAGASALLDEAAEVAAEMDLPDVLVPALAKRARRPGGDVEGASAALDEHRDRLGVGARLEALVGLHEATGEREYLSEANRLLDDLVEHAPEEHRETMLEDVPLHRLPKP